LQGRAGFARVNRIGPVKADSGAENLAKILAIVILGLDLRQLFIYQSDIANRDIFANILLWVRPYPLEIFIPSGVMRYV